MRIVETNAEIKKIIEKELNDHFTAVWKAVAPRIEAGTRYLVINAIKKQPEYDALLHGRLYAEFGLTDVNSKLNSILDTWSKSITTSRVGNKFRVEAIPYDFNDVLGLPAAQQATNKGQSLEWLDWLLLKGDKTIIREYEVSFNVNARSRTGQAVMVEKKRAKWGVPHQYSGTKTNNWVSRAIDDITENEIEDIVLGEIGREW